MKTLFNTRQMTAVWMLAVALLCSATLAPPPAAAQEGTADLSAAPADSTVGPEVEPAETPQPEAPEPEITEPEASEAEITESEATEPAEARTVEPTAIVPETNTSESPNAPETNTPETDAAKTDAKKTEQEGTSQFWSILYGALLLLGLLVLPILIGNACGKKFGMPDHAWKISLALATIAAATVAVGFALTTENGFKLGPDLGGGVTLIYDLEDPEQLLGEGGQTDENAPASGRKFTMNDMLAALKERIDRSGTKEITIRTRGQAIEFIIPKAGGAELDRIKQKILELGELEFRILADRTRQEYEAVINLAERLPKGRMEVHVNGTPTAKWVQYNVDEFGPVNPSPDDDRGAGFVKREGLKSPELLVMLDRNNVTGEYLTSVSKGIGKDGFEVRFNFNAVGANRFGNLTQDHIPNPNPYFLGIILDKKVLSAPTIRSRITNGGTISGRTMDEAEVDRVVGILNAGSLPAALETTPVSESHTGPEIGELTMQQGKRAMMVSLSIVLVFILFYYRFAGLVACLALIANIVLVVGAMVSMKAAFTLPGLAGLVLTVGMSVDANVLIFERIREELARGTTLRMAIRNGFDRATTTIVDANVTTLITGLVLYTIGTDQIKGFAVTLILGILMSMYTAIFCSRILFDVAERQGWLTQLNMRHVLPKTDLHFMSKWPAASMLSIIVIVAGLLGVVGRRDNLLNIDFTGGTSITMVLKDNSAMPLVDVREALLQTELKDKNLLVVGRDHSSKNDAPANTVYKVDCNLLDNKDDPSGLSAVEQVEKILADTFEGKLVKHTASSSPLTSFSEGEEGENQYNGFETVLEFGNPDTNESLSGVTYDTVKGEVELALKSVGQEDIEPSINNPEYTDGSSQRFRQWTVRLSDLSEDDVNQVIHSLVTKFNSTPIYPLANKIGGRVAGDMRLQAIYAIFVSLLGIVGYIWIRFQKISYGLAAVIALLHDVLITLGVLALSAYVVQFVPLLASSLQMNAFQISLPVVAAFLTIIGYSLNDTIVVFDRVREVRGKDPNLTAVMLDKSINQTLSRTLLTSLTTLLVVGILYFFGGDGIHTFAFALVTGVFVGTYSSIFVASPALLWLSRIEKEWSA